VEKIQVRSPNSGCRQERAAARDTKALAVHPILVQIIPPEIPNSEESRHTVVLYVRVNPPHVLPFQSMLGNAITTLVAAS